MADPNKWDTFAAQARAKGYSWDEINGYVGQRVNTFRAQAKAQGYNDQEIDGYLGYQSPHPVVEHLQQTAQANLDAQPDAQQHAARNPVEAFKAGLEASSGGLIVRGKLPDTILPEHAGIASRLASSIGEFSGDLPAMIAGFVGGAAVGGGSGRRGWRRRCGPRGG
jgi:hypothetical protein